MTREKNTPYKATPADKWALYGTWAILAIIALTTHGVAIVLHGLVQFMTGDIANLQSGHYGYEWMLPTVLGAIVVAVPIMAVASWLAGKLYGKATSNSMQRRTMGLRKLDGATALVVKTTVWRDILEETYARAILLGIATVPLGALIGKTAAFYVLFVFGALPQVLEYRHMYHAEREQMQLGRLWPQLVGMIILATVFAQFGLVASILVHVLYNLVLASLDRYTAHARRGAWRVIAGSSTFVMTGLTGLLVMSTTPRQILHLQVSGFYGYLWASLLFSGLLMLVLELLMYDPEPLEVGLVRKVPVGPSISEAIYKGKYRVVTDEQKPSTVQLFAGEVFNALSATLVTCMFVLLAHSLDHLFGPIPRVYWITIVAAPVVLMYLFGSRSVSINGTARLVWENAPVLLLIISAFPVIGFWPAAAVSICRELACRLVRRSIRYVGM